MKYNLVFNNEKEPKPLKEVFSLVVEELGQRDDFVYLDADLMSAIGTKKWADNNKDKAFNVGVAEANMAGIAAGLSVGGLKPMMHTFGPFASRRCFDQVFLSIGYAKADVLIIGSDPGVTAGYNGGTHMPFEDVALYRVIPNSTIIDITDATMLTNIIPKLLDMPGPKYVRFGRKDAFKVYADDSDFEVGKAAILKEGGDVAIMASGIMVAQALIAAKMLEDEGISASVLDIFSIKPLDEETVVNMAKKCQAIVTAENHNVTGGMGSAITDLLAKTYPVPVEKVGVIEQFGEVGPQDYLQEKFGLTAQNIYENAKKVISRKVK